MNKRKGKLGILKICLKKAYTLRKGNALFNSKIKELLAMKNHDNYDVVQ